LADLLSQLRSEKAFLKYDYGSAALDPWLTAQLVQILTDAGVQDIRDITMFDGIVPQPSDMGVVYVHTSYLYDARTGKMLSNPLRDIGQGPEVIGNVTNDDYAFAFAVRFLGSVPYFTVSVKRKGGQPGSWWKSIAQAVTPLVPVIMVGASILGPGLGQLIGEAIMGAGAPLASIVGNATIGAALSGGDIDRAVRSAVAAFAPIPGGAIGTAADSAAIGAAATAALSAAVQGGDIKSAVVMSLARSGVQKVDDSSYLFSGLDAGANPFFSLDSPAVEGLYSGGPAMPDITLASANEAPLPATVYSNPGDGYDWGSQAAGPLFPGTGISDANTVSFPDDTVLQQVDVPVYTQTPPLPSYPSGASPGNDTGLSDLALFALQAVQAYLRTGTAVQPARTSTVTANANGTLTTRDATGRVVTVKPAVGVPYALPGGGAIVNNGNNTFTRINPDGTSTTAQYSKIGATGLSSLSPMTLGLLGLGAVLLLRG